MKTVFIRRIRCGVAVASPVALICIVFGQVVADDEPTQPRTQLALRGKLLLSEKLDTAPAEIIKGTALAKVKSGWKFFSGQWKHVDGAMTGAMLDTDRRGAQAVCVFPFKDAIFQFDVRLDGCRQVQFRIQDAIPEHICRVTITRDGFAAQKDDHDHAGPDQPVPFGKVALPIKSGEWKTVLVEILGSKMSATIDGKSVTGTHPLLTEPKHFFEFIVTGKFASFRNLHVWEARSGDEKGRK
jgi:hypothetical protein